MFVQSIAIALAFNGIDIITGFVAALRNKSLQSSRLRDGIFKKVGFIFCYILAYIIDHYGEIIGFQIGIYILPIIILYVCTTEIVSIIENICKINPDLVPSKLMELFNINQEEK